MLVGQLLILLSLQILEKLKKKFLILVDQLLMRLSIKNWKSQKKLPDNSKYITIKEFHQLSDEQLNKRLKQAKLATTNDLDNVKQLATKNKEKTEKLKHMIQVFLLVKAILTMMDFQDFLYFDQFAKLPKYQWSYRHNQIICI